MKRYLAVAVAGMFLLATLTACQPTAAMIEAEKAFYQAQVEISKNRGGGNPVLLEIKAQDATKDMIFSNVASITVFAPPSKDDAVGPTQYRQVDYSAPWVSVAGGILGMATIAAGGVYLAHELKGFGGNYTATPTVVEQPAPVIVEQPAPIIVEQPPPVIVK